MPKSIYIGVMLLLGIGFWELIPLRPVLNPVTVPVLLALWALFGLVHYRRLPPLYAQFELNRCRSYYLWFYAGIALSVLPSYFFWNQDLLSSVIVNRGLIIYAFVPVLFAIKPTDREILRGVVMYTFVYMLVWTVQAVLVPVPVTVPFLERMMAGAPFEIDPGDFGKLLPGYTVILLGVYLSFQRYYQQPSLQRLLPAMLLFLVIFLLQNRGTLFFASGVLLYIFISIKSAYKPYQLLGFGMLALVVLYLTAGSWMGMITETREQAGDMDYDRWKALRFFVFEFPPNALTYLLGNGRFSFHSDAGADTLALSMAGYDQSDIGLVGFWSIYGLLPVGVILTMMFLILVRPVYPFYLRALALHVLAIPIAWNFVSSDSITLVLVFYLFAYYAEAGRLGHSARGLTPDRCVPNPDESTTRPDFYPDKSTIHPDPDPHGRTTRPAPELLEPTIRPRLVYVSPDCFFDTDYLVLRHLAAHYQLTWIALVTVQGNRVTSAGDLRRFADEHAIELRIKELNWRKTSWKQWQFDRSLAIEISRMKYDLIYIEDLGDPFFYALQPWYLKRKSTVYALHDVVPHSTGSGLKSKIARFQFGLTRWMLMRWARHFHIFSRTEYEKFRIRYPRKEAFYTRLMLRWFGPSAALPGSIGTECRLLFFGVVAYYKGLDLLIDAIEQLYAEGITTIRLTIAGKGPHWDDCATRIKTPELFRLKVRYIADEEIPDLMSEHHFMVLPYRDASQSGPQMIALNYHLPVIVSDVEGLSDYVEHRQTGMVYRNGEKAGATLSDAVGEAPHAIPGSDTLNATLRDALREAARMSDNDYQELRRRLQEWTARNYSEEETMGRYVQFFNRLL